MERQRMTERLSDRAKLVDSVAVIAVRVSHDYAVETTNLGGKQLLPEVRSAIDEQAFSVALDEDRGAQPGIPRLGRVAAAPIISDLRNAGRRTATENPKLHSRPF